METEW